VKKIESLIDFKADRKTIQKSAFNSIVIQIIFKMKGFITMPILTYYLAPKEMGIYNLIIVTASLLTPLFYMNLADGPVVYLVQEKSGKRIQDMYNTVVSSSLMFFTFFSIIFLFFVSQYSSTKYRYLYFVVPVIFSSIFYKLFSYIFAVFQKTSIVVKNTFFKDVFDAVLGILLVVLGFSYKGFIFANIISSIIGGIYIYRFARRDFPLRLFIDKKILLKFLKISLTLMPISFFSWIIHSSDSYFLLYFKGENSVGKYSIVYGLCNMILILTWALNFFWFPLSARLWIENKEKYRKFFVNIFTVFAVILMMGVLLFEFNSKFIMRFFARRLEYQDAYGIMGVIAFAFGMQVLITLLTAPLYSNKNTSLIFVSYVVGGFVNFVFNFLLIPSYGIWGATISTALSYGIVVILMSYFNYRIARFRFFDKRLVYITIIFAPIWLGITLLRSYVVFYQLLIVDIALLLLGGSLIYFKILNKEEKQYFFSLYKPSFRDNK
jgi:O-antigen/teichoic acid export membrane protein